LADVAAAGLSVVFDASDRIPDVPLASRVVAQSGASVRVAVEPIKHTSLPEMQAALQTATQLHAGCSVHAEDTGDHVLVGSSELYLDVVLHAIRARLCGKRHPLRLTDPYVAFSETVAAAPRGMLRTATNEHGVSIAVVAAPASREVTAAFDSGAMSMAMPRAALERRLEREFGWDLLEASGLAACGPDPHHGPSFLIDDTLGDGGPAASSGVTPDVMSAIAAGFRAAVKRGPLCGEVVRGVKIYLVSVSLGGDDDGAAPVAVTRQVLNSVSTLARQVVKAALLSAAPRLLEPHLAVDVITRPTHAKAVEEVLRRRRGGVAAHVRLAATQLCRLQCVVPVVDSFGLDTELRTKVSEELLATSSLSHWSLVPGDPMDDSAVLLPLQAASGTQLARDFMLKTRRRKGLPDAVAVV